MTDVERRPWTRRDAKPYESGNREALKHGAYSPVVVAETSKKVLAELMDLVPYIDEMDAVAVDTWCKAKARYDLLNDYVMGLAAKRGVSAVPEKLWGETSRAEGNVMDATDKLGLDPSSRARLMKDMGLAKQLASRGVNDLVERGRELRRKKAAELRGS